MNLLVMNPHDNVAVAAQMIPIDSSVDWDKGTVVALEEIPCCHKVALRSISTGDPVIRYGHSIGKAICPIQPGQWVHSHNLQSSLSETLYLHYTEQASTKLPATERRTFEGYRRDGDRVGIRNEIWVIPMVGCVTETARRIAEKAHNQRPRSIDGVYTFAHPNGCSQLGCDLDSTRQILAGLAQHPNTAGVLLLGLGCENNDMESFLQLMQSRNRSEPGRVEVLICQDVDYEYSAASQMIQRLFDAAADDRRETIDWSKLVVGLKCGGSDSMSGITANPLIGALADRLVASGGSVVLTEVPEMFGAEEPLLSHCADIGVFNRACNMLQRFRDYYVQHGQPINENPSPGNRKGGITTLEEKSLGCISKSGHGPITDVLSYGEPVSKQGVSLLEGPGNDIIAVTSLAASGAHMVLFSTGRGTPLGGPIPSIKIASNQSLAESKPHWIDFNAGPLAVGQPMNDATDQLTELVCQIASGKQHTRSEVGGHRETAIWKRGVTL